MNSRYKIFDGKNRHFISVAVLNAEPDELAKSLGVTFEFWDRDFDLLDHVAFVLPSGNEVVLKRYRNSPDPGTQLALPENKVGITEKCLEEILKEFRLTMPTLTTTWVRPKA